MPTYLDLLEEDNLWENNWSQCVLYSGVINRAKVVPRGCALLRTLCIPIFLDFPDADWIF